MVEFFCGIMPTKINRITISSLYGLTKTIASMGATNVQMAFVPFPEDNQQLDFK